MKISKDFALWEITQLAAKEGSRPPLEHILAAKAKPYEQPNVKNETYPEWMVMPLSESNNDFTNGVAIATDGFSLAVVPLELYDEDFPGTIPGELLKEAAQKAAVQGQIYLELREDEIIIPFAGQKNQRDKNLSFPDVRNIIEDVRNRMAGNERKVDLTIDNVRLNKLLKALGVKTTGNPGDDRQVSLYSLSKEGQTGMVLVTQQNLRQNKTIVPPFGLLMEMHKR